MAQDAAVGYISVEKGSQVEPTHRVKLGTGMTLSKDTDDVVEIAASLSVSVLNDIGNVNTPSPADEEFLVYDTGTAKWRNRKILSGDVEVGDLPTHSHGKTDLPAAVAYEDEANTFTGNQKVSGAQFYTGLYNIGVVGGGTTAINWNNGNIQKVQLNGNQTIDVSGSNHKAGVTYTLWVKKGSYTLTWQGVSWGDAGAPSLGSTFWDVVQFQFLTDGGSTGAAFHAGGGFNVTE